MANQESVHNLRCVQTSPWLLLLWIVTFSSITHAQTATGDIAGRVTDKQNGVIPGAQVKAEGVSNADLRSTITNAEGIFSLPLLPPGRYRVSVSAPHMSNGVVEISLLVGAHQEVNFVLQLAVAQTSVLVTGQIPSIETTSSELKSNIDSRQMLNLPLDGRTFASLAILVPGVRPTSPGSDSPISINSSTGRNFNLTVDGGENKSHEVSGFLQSYTTEGIQEFVVKTYNFDADANNSQGAVINIVTRAGTNHLRGGAFFVFQNRNLNATDFFTAHPFESSACGNPQACYSGPGNRKAGFDRHNYGGSLGGPIIGNRWFFFGAVEHIHQNQSLPQNGATIETLKSFQTLQLLGAIADPLLAKAKIDPGAFVPIPFRDTQWQVRTDIQVSQRHRVYFRYAQQGNIKSHDGMNGFEDPGSGAETSNDFKSLVANYTFVITPRTLNQFAFQVSDSFSLSLPEVVAAGIPNIAFDNGVSLGQSSFLPTTVFQRQFQFRDDFTWQKGKHLLKFGAQESALSSLGGVLAQFPTPSLQIRCLPQQIINGGVDPCGYGFSYTNLDQPGVVERTRLSSGDPRYFQNWVHQFGLYMQDNWRISSRLTINLGIRNDFNFGWLPPQAPTMDASFFCDSCQGNRTWRILSLVDQNALRKLVPGISLQSPHNLFRNYAPRVGFAWDVTGRARWVIRGGYGLFFDQFFQIAQTAALQNSSRNIYSVSHDIRSGADPTASSAIGLSEAITAAGPYPISRLTDLPYSSRGWMLDPGLKVPYAQHASLGTQFQLSPNLTLALNAVHVLGLHGYSLTEIDPSLDSTADTRILNPVLDEYFGCRDISDAQVACGSGVRHRLFRTIVTGSANRARYDGLMIQVQRRFAGRVQFDAWYLLSTARGYGGAAGAGESDILASSQGTGPRLSPTQSALVGLVQAQNFGYAAEDERHRYIFDGILNLPHGIVFSGILQFASARPYSMMADDDINGDGVFNDLYSARVTGDPVFDPLGEGDVRFSVRPNTLRGDSFLQTDLRVQKTFKMRERYEVSVFAELFNVFNRVNFGNQFVSDAAGFGAVQPPVPVLTGLNGPSASALPRKPVGLSGAPFHAQLGLRIQF